MSIRSALLWPLLLSPAVALAQVAPAQPAPRSGFESLWTGWSGASRDAIRAEEQAARASAQAATATAQAPRAYQAGSAALGERVGEVVRLGDCAEGERLAREAGDFPLLDAVRAHCRPAAQRR